MTKKTKKRRKTVESTPQETSQKASKKQKTVVEPTAPSQCSGRILRQDSVLTRATKYLKEDMKALNVTYVPASRKSEVIPNVQARNIPQEYFLPNISSDMLRRPTFKVNDIQAPGHVRTFFHNLHRVVMNANVDIGTQESKTDTLINNILTRVIDFQDWPLSVRVKESYNFFVNYKKVSAKPEYVVVDKEKIFMIIVEDKHLKNVRITNYGEAQMMIEVLACGYENLHRAGTFTDQTIFAVRVVSSYVTFYKSEISARYWKEIRRGLPQKEEIKVSRWPPGINPVTGLDLAELDGRQAVLTALAQIRQFISNTTTASQDRAGSSTTTVSQDRAGSSTTTASQDQAGSSTTKTRQS